MTTSKPRPPCHRSGPPSWLRRVAPDLLIAACAALAIMAVIHQLEAREQTRMVAEIRSAAVDGLTLDERLGAYESSIGRSVRLQLPLLAVAGGLVVGAGCRQRRWAWLTAIAAALPALAMGVAYFIDRPAPAAAVTAAYALCAAIPASAVARLRRPRPEDPTELP